MMNNHRLFGMTAFLACLLASACSDKEPGSESASAALEQQLAQLRLEQERISARGDVENVFARYQYLHTAFRDEEIIDTLWVKPDTPGISAQYNNTGTYTSWESVMEYHRNRPSPEGKLLVHFLASPLIEVAGDGQTAKGVWIVAGVESGLSDPAVAEKAPASMFEPGLVNGKKVWAHWIQVRYYLDFMKQDGEWRIWHFRCVEISRAPFNKNWIAFAAELEANKAAGEFNQAIAYFGEDGKPVFMPPVDAPAKNIAHPYRTNEAFELEPPLPEPYETFSETTEY
jgi:hypothetical protein